MTRISKYASMPGAQVCSKGGSVRVTVTVNPTVISSQPCRVAYVTALVGSTVNAEILRVNVYSVATSTKGINVPMGSEGAMSLALTTTGAPPLVFYIQSLSMLSFYAPNVSNLDKVDVLWMG